MTCCPQVRQVPPFWLILVRWTPSRGLSGECLGVQQWLAKVAVSWFHDCVQKPRLSPQRQDAPPGIIKQNPQDRAYMYLDACVLSSKGVVWVQNRVACVMHLLDDCTNYRKEYLVPKFAELEAMSGCGKKLSVLDCTCFWRYYIYCGR